MPDLSEERLRTLAHHGDIQVNVDRTSAWVIEIEGHVMHYQTPTFSSLAEALCNAETYVRNCRIVAGNRITTD